MILLVLILILTVWAVLSAVPVFECVCGTLMLVPLLWFLLMRLAHADSHALSGPGLYVLCFSLILGAAWYLCGGRKRRPTLEGLLPIIFLCVVYACAYTLCLAWPDFFDLGERLRDYALLASTVDSPVIPREPWMEGYALNYYVYWYRFAAMLHELLGIPVWQLYHVMVAFAISFYAATLFQVMRVVVGVGPWCAAVSSLALSFGSNVAGTLLLMRSEGGGWQTDVGWWGPSRVVQGAINEFPAWSFLLGDAHPHYLNLAAMPFFLLILYRIWASSLPVVPKLGQAVGCVVAAALFLKGSNVWEVPMWGGLVVTLAAVWGVRRSSECASVGALLERIDSAVSSLITECGAALKGLWRSSGLVWVVGWGCVWLALWLSSAHIVPEGGSVALVRSPIPVTTTVELLLHFGWQLLVILVSLLLLLPPARWCGFVGLFLVGALAFDKAAVLLFVCAAILILSMVTRGEADAVDDGCVTRTVFLDAIILAAFGLVLVPEYIFLDDPYGGENERMNTIFKIYTTAWGLLGVSAVAALRRATSRVRRLCPGQCACLPGWVPSVGAVLCACLVLGVTGRFIAVNSPHRANVPSDANLIARVLPAVLSKGYSNLFNDKAIEGLETAERFHPGSAEVIRRLRSLPHGRVLEAQGNAYSFTSFVSSLSGQPSYLGWVNHVDLLTKQYGESSRRKGVTASIYTDESCEQRRDLAAQEGITYIVVGTLEARQHPGVRSRDFSCLSEVVRSGEYVVYARRE